MDNLIHSLKTLPITSFVYTVNCELGQYYEVIKFDGMLNVESIYTPHSTRSGDISCDCFAGRYGKCRHRPIILTFNLEKRTNKRWFYDWDDHRWYMPVNVGRV